MNEVIDHGVCKLIETNMDGYDVMIIHKLTTDQSFAFRKDLMMDITGVIENLASKESKDE